MLGRLIVSSKEGLSIFFLCISIGISIETGPFGGVRAILHA